MKSAKQTRRKFIKQSAAVTTGMLLAPEIRLLGSSSPINRSKVILAHSPGVIDDTGKVDPVILQDLLDKSILELTGYDSLKKAWKNYFSSEDIIGFKVNGNSYSVLQGTPMTNHFPLITDAILKSYAQAGLSESNAIIWERSDAELKSMGYEIQKEKGKLRIMGSHIERRRSAETEGGYQPWFSETEHAVGSKSTHLSNILERDCTALINLPCLKSHRLAGVTGALKNHYGSIDNPREFHDDDCCNPGVAEINNIPVIRDRHKLVICNALMGLWEGGPRWNLANMWMEGSLIIGEDPVAVDTVMLQMIDKKRTEAGLQPVTPRAKHLALSEAIGLGNSKLENIDLVKIEV
jgi:hypothetical protein